MQNNLREPKNMNNLLQRYLNQYITGNKVM